MERLTVLRTAWNLGSDRMPQPWFRFSNTHTKRKLMSRLHSAFEAFAAKRSASIPAGLCNDMADDFHFAHCLTKLHKKNMTPYVFKYKHEFYQEVSNFCNNYKELRTSAAKAEVSRTELQRVAAKTIQKHSLINTHKRPAQVLQRKKRSKFVIRDSWKGK